jgi:hypothetical protein
LAACIVALGLAAACGDSSDGESHGAAGNGGTSGAGGAPSSGGSAGSTSGVAGAATSAGTANSGAGKSNGGDQNGNGGTNGGTSSAQGGKVGHGGEPDGDAGEGGGQEPSGGAGNGGDTGEGEGGDPSCREPLAQPPGASCGVYGTVGAEQHIEQATEQLSLRAELRVGPLGPVRLDEVELHYYFSQEETSGFQAKVDSFVLQPGDVDLTSTSEIAIVPLVPHQNSSSGPGCQTHFVRIRNNSALLLEKSDEDGKPFVELHFTLKPNNPAPPNQAHDNDHSYHAGLAAFVCGSLVSGCTPGDAGTCN